MRKGEQEVIVAFVGHLGILKGHLNLSVDRWPDKENRTEPEIDAIAGDFAIEHTSIDSVANQRQLNDWYLRVVKNLDQVIRDCVDCGLIITLDFYAIGKGNGLERYSRRSQKLDCRLRTISWKWQSRNNSSHINAY